nr:PepSY domain-containing protein [uncultured Tyzzerella sp.]
MKKFISGLLIGGIVMTSATAFAANVVNMQAVYSVKSLVVNGVDTGKGSSAFVSNGTTYVPLRTVSDALGHEISWDSKTKTIYINTGSGSTGGTNGEPTDLPTTNGGATTLPAPTPSPAPPVNNGGSWNGQKLVSMETAKNAAIKAVGGGNVIWQEADIYEHDDLPTYDFKIVKDNRTYEVEINALTGQVIDFDID